MHAFEIRDLTQHFSPQGCVILSQVLEPCVAGRGRRETYLVQTADLLLLFRLCSDRLESGHVLGFTRAQVLSLAPARGCVLYTEMY